MPAIRSLHELLIDDIKALYDAENVLARFLPKMIRAAANDQLRDCLQEHLKQTKIRAIRLDRAANLLGAKATGKVCHAMEGLLRECDEAAQIRGPDGVRDAKLIGVALRVEHYEMAGYGAAHTFALRLGEPELAALLQESLDEKSAMERKLTFVARTVNDEAANAHDE